MSMQSNLQPFLDRLTRHSRLSDRESQAVLELPAFVAQTDTNRDIVRLRQRVDHAVLVIDGVIGRFDQNSEGLRQITAIHIAGDMANLHSVVQPCATSALQALSTATVMHVPHVSLRHLTARFPAIAEALWRDTVIDASVLAQWVVNVGRRTAVSRIAHLLCELVTRYRMPTEGHRSLRFPLTHVHLADASGLTAVHVCRTLKTLRDTGLAYIYSKTLHILDWNALVRLADFDPTYLQIQIKPEERLRIVA